MVQLFEDPLHCVLQCDSQRHIFFMMLSFGARAILLMIWMILARVEGTTTGVRHLAVVRPFSNNDYPRLASSFDNWNTWLPCATAGEASEIEVDLFICSSQSLDSNAAMQGVVQDILDAFLGNLQPWHSCFRNVFHVSANMLSSEDVYITDSANSTTRTARGPNLQFLRIAQNLMDGSWGTGMYDSLMLMEMDTVPVRRGWLDAIAGELNVNAPYVVYGSNYRGSRWDSFFGRMSPAMQFHINGNAVYNLSSPYFERLVSNVSAEVAKDTHSAYDLIMAQYVLDNDVDLIGLYKPTARFISNYVHMTMVASFLGDEYLIHGAKIVSDWNPVTDSVALVVSDWGNAADLGKLLDSLKTVRHPFREVVVYQPAAYLPATLQSTESITVDGAEIATMTIKYVERTDVDSNDWCNADVSSRWMVYTNAYFSLRSPTGLMQSASGQPVLHYVNKKYCVEYGACDRSLARAAEFAGAAVEGHFYLHEMVFRSDKKAQFCAAWQTWYRDNAPPCDPVLGPTADDYMAWLGAAGEAPSIYDIQSKDKYDAPGILVQQVAPPVDPRPCSMYRAAQRNWLLTNFTGCSVLRTQADCEAAAALSCAWRAGLGSCYAAADFTVPIAVEVVDLGQCGGNTSFNVPKIRIRSTSATAVPLTVDVSRDLYPEEAPLPVTLGAGASVTLGVGVRGPGMQGQVTVVAVRPTKTWTRSVAVAAVDLRPLLFFTNMLYTDATLVATDQRAWQLRVSPRNRLRFTLPSSVTAAMATGIVPEVIPDPDLPGWYRAKDAFAGHHITIGKGLIPHFAGVNMQVMISGDVQGRSATRCYDFTVRYAPALPQCGFSVVLPAGQRGLSGETYAFSVAALPPGVWGPRGVARTHTPGPAQRLRRRAAERLVRADFRPRGGGRRRVGEGTGGYGLNPPAH